MRFEEEKTSVGKIILEIDGDKRKIEAGKDSCRDSCRHNIAYLLSCLSDVRNRVLKKFERQLAEERNYRDVEVIIKTVKAAYDVYSPLCSKAQ